mgnify:CR=1 FL=1
MDLMQEIIARAKANKQRIVLPEGTEERTLKAADRLVADEVADIILIGNPAEINSLAAQYGLNHIGQATIIDPKNHEKKAAYADLLFQLRQKKGMTPEKAAVLVEDPLFLACLMIKSGDADGEIAGAQKCIRDRCIASCFADYQDCSGYELRFGRIPDVHKNSSVW